MQRVGLIHVEGKRGRGSLKIIWDEIVRKDLILLHLSKSVALNRAAWSKKTHVAKPS